MRSIWQQRYLCVAAMLAATAAPRAGVAAPLPAGMLPAGTTWVIHVDVEAIRKSAAGRELRRQWLGKPEVQQGLERLRREIGIDPARDLLSVTAYDSRFAEQSGVLVLRVDRLNQQQLLGGLQKKHPEHQVARHGRHPLYTWTMRKGAEDQHHVTGSFHGADTIVLARDPAQVRTALDVLDGNAESVAADATLAARPAEGTIFLARGVGMSQQQTPFRARLIREARRLAVSAGVQGDRIFASGTLEAESAEMAQQCHDVVEGFRAMVRLRSGQNETARRVLEGLEIKAVDAVVTASWQADRQDVEDLLEMIKKGRQKPAKNSDSQPKD